MSDVVFVFPLSCLLYQDPGGSVRQAEIALLDRLSSEHMFPCSDDAIAVLCLLTEHLELKLPKEDPTAWEAVEQTFKLAHVWAVSNVQSVGV